MLNCSVMFVFVNLICIVHLVCLACFASRYSNEYPWAAAEKGRSRSEDSCLRYLLRALFAVYFEKRK